MVANKPIPEELPELPDEGDQEELDEIVEDILENQDDDDPIDDPISETDDNLEMIPVDALIETPTSPGENYGDGGGDGGKESTQVAEPGMIAIFGMGLIRRRRRP